MKKIILLLIILLISSITFAEEVSETSIMDGQATIQNVNGPNGLLKMNLNSGWNLVPIKFFGSASGRYWDQFRAGNTTCDQQIFQGTWMQITSQNQYHQIGVIDDWLYADTRGDSLLLEQKQNKSYNGNSGSLWVYTKNACTLATEDGAYWTFPTQGEHYTLKKGWNFFVIDRTMATKEATLSATLKECGASKYNVWDSKTQSWKYSTTQTITDASEGLWTKTLTDNDVYTTVIIKTTKDCQLTSDSIKKSVGPPSLPGDDTVAQEPTKVWEISNFELKENTIYFNIENKTNETLDLVKIELGPGMMYEYDAPTAIKPSYQIEVIITQPTNCTEGTSYEFQKENIIITYNSNNINYKKQFWDKDVVVTCEHNSDKTEAEAKEIWKNSEPFGITDWSKTNNNIAIMLINNSFDTLTLKGVQIGTTEYKLALTNTVAPGATIQVNLPSTTCSIGEEYTYPKSGILITYDTANIQGKKEFGIANIVATCN
jgi:hypothetical protein